MRGGNTDSDGSTAGGGAAVAPGVVQCPRQLQKAAPPSGAQSRSWTQSRAQTPFCVLQYIPCGHASSNVHARGVTTRLAIKPGFLGQAGSGGTPASDGALPTH
jgi:hypothetical protein